MSSPGKGGTSSGSRGGSRTASQSGGGGGSSGSSLPEGTQFRDQGFRREYSVDVGGEKVSLTVSEQMPSARSHGEIAFTIGGSYSKGKLAGRDADRAALKVMRMAKHDAANRQDGYIYSTRAFKEDGAGKQRRQLYERFGFSKPTRTGQPQYAIVKNGKLEPYTPKGKAPALRPDF